MLCHDFTMIVDFADFTMVVDFARKDFCRFYDDCRICTNISVDFTIAVDKYFLRYYDGCRLCMGIFP